MTRRQHISAPAHVWHSLTFFDHIFWACDLASWPFRAFFGRHFILLSSAQTMKLKHHDLLHSMKPGNPVSRSQAIVSLHSLRDKLFRSIYKLIPNHLHVLHVIYRNILVLWFSMCRDWGLDWTAMKQCSCVGIRSCALCSDPSLREALWVWGVKRSNKRIRVWVNSEGDPTLRNQA